MSRRALVLGGSGHVGAEVVRGLRAAGAEVNFTYRTAEARARALADQTGARAHAIELRDRAALRALCERLAGVDVLVHCAAAGTACALAEIGDDDWDAALEVNARAPFVACQTLAPSMERGGDVVLVCAPGGVAPVPAPAHVGASQAALLGLTRTLAKELGPRDIRANLVVLGVLDGGVAARLDPRRLADFKKYSAFQRVGTAVEAARAIVRLALANRFMTGQMVPVSGGL